MKVHERAIERLVREGYDFDMNHAIDRGYKIFTSKMGPFVGFTAIYFVINLIAGNILAGVGTIVLRGPLLAGLFIVANAVVRNEEIKFEMFFDGFKMFLPLFLVELISQIFIGVGVILLVIPGIYLAVAYSFSLLFVTFFNMDFWPAMEASRKIISKNFWPFLGFFVILTLINVLGLIVLGVGLLFTFPATYCMVYAAFEQVVGNAIRAENEPQQQSSYSTGGTTYTY